MTSTVAHHQGVIETFWLQLWRLLHLYSLWLNKVLLASNHHSCVQCLPGKQRDFYSDRFLSVLLLNTGSNNLDLRVIKEALLLEVTLIIGVAPKDTVANATVSLVSADTIYYLLQGRQGERGFDMGQKVGHILVLHRASFTC